MSPTRHALRRTHPPLSIVGRPCREGHSGGAGAPTPSRLGAGLGLVLALGACQASARSLPKAEPAPAVRACPEMGDGFVRLPGSDTCVKLGGSLRVEFMKQGGTGAADR